jgi:ABC transport system ATP-binding/permease protein
MTAEDALSLDAVRPLVVRAQGSAKTLEAGPAYSIGRDPAADIAVDEPLVSWRHAVVRVVDGQWLLEDADSTNGTFAAGQRVRRVAITDSCQLRLGHPDAVLAGLTWWRLHQASPGRRR